MCCTDYSENSLRFVGNCMCPHIVYQCDIRTGAVKFDPNFYLPQHNSKDMKRKVYKMNTGYIGGQRLRAGPLSLGPGTEHCLPQCSPHS